MDPEELIISLPFETLLVNPLFIKIYRTYLPQRLIPALSPSIIPLLQAPPPATEGVLLKKGVLKNFTNFTRKHLCWSLFIKRDSNTGIFL